MLSQLAARAHKGVTKSEASTQGADLHTIVCEVVTSHLLELNNSTYRDPIIALSLTMADSASPGPENSANALPVGLPSNASTRCTLQNSDVSQAVSRANGSL